MRAMRLDYVSRVVILISRFAALTVMGEECDQNDNRDWHPEEIQQNGTHSVPPLFLS
jgi:hypothetical protein